MTSPIAILTDFGTRDPYVGIMKGVILSRANVPLIDITHAIPPGDIRRGAFVLWQTYRHFPKGTVFLAVVDPGVGSSRLPVIMESEGYRFIAPDNGLLTYVIRPSSRAWALANPAFQRPFLSATFHGRDIFAPAAAYAALDVPGRAFGPVVPALQRFSLPLWRLDEDVLHGEVLHADQFGNLITSLGVFREEDGAWWLSSWLTPDAGAREFTPGAVVLEDGKVLPVVKTFSDLQGEEVGALVGSSGLIELVANRRSAASLLHLRHGSKVQLHAISFAPQEETEA